MTFVTVTCSEQYSSTTALFEPCDSGLSAGLLASPALVRVERGTAYVPIVNVGATDVLLYPRTEVGSLEDVNVVSLPSGVVEIPSVVATMASQLWFELPLLVVSLPLFHLPLTCHLWRMMCHGMLWQQICPPFVQQFHRVHALAPATRLYDGLYDGLYGPQLVNILMFTIS
ncbi:hypothetical protein N1851_033864 [Merluccius polli]|uniref:Uncharacterized protein n=1 Tax=Merluccius polli TaxID=89951 RepID=A0AA47NM40_MERPO|nr:hypothetical protein N1851_033864 [Merluccius polli]